MNGAERLAEGPRPIQIPVSEVVYLGNEERYALDAIRSTWISSTGRYVGRFEDEFASFIGVPHGVSVANGTCALHLALEALDVGVGDEVILPSLTFGATANAVIQAGARPVLVDSSVHHWNMDPTEVARAVSSRTRAIIPVHLFGQACDMGALLEIARAHGLSVVEDAAEAHGASWEGRKVGGIGDIGCFSFYGNKVITTGEGGMCVTASADLARRMNSLKSHGMTPQRRYWHEEPGFNYRLTNVAAAIGVAQLEGIEQALSRRAEIARIYREGLSSIPGLLVHPEPTIGTEIHWLFCVFLAPGSRVGRDDLMVRMAGKGVETRRVFTPMHAMPAFKDARRVGKLTNAERFSDSGICLPLHLGLSDEDAWSVVQVMHDILQG
jgi:perosamine synthetase